jgi:hypothetical protein
MSLSGRPPLLTMTSALAAVVGLIALLMVLLPTALFGGGAPTNSVTPPHVPAIARLDLPTLETFKGIIDRPMFNPGRAPDPQPPAEAAKSALPALSDYKLVGLVLTKGTKIALVERRQAKQIVTLHPGDEIDGRHVEDIGSDGVHLSGGPVRELLSMPRIAGISRSGRKDAATPEP